MPAGNAIVHTGGDSEGPTASVQLRNAASGSDTGDALTVTLQPGEWYQWTRVIELAHAEISQATALVTKVSGDGTFLAYGAVNDAVTSDGSSSG